MTTIEKTLDKYLSSFIVLCLDRGLDFLPKLKKPLWQNWYNWISGSENKGKKWTFMNYGYRCLDESEEEQTHMKFKSLDLTHIRPEQYPMARLYYFLMSYEGLVYKNKNLLEIGSGRGGGASFITSNFQINSYLGVDLSKKATKFCRKVHLGIPRLTFNSGDSEKLPVQSGSKEIILNVESSHCYPNFQKFSDEAFRVLAPGGVLLFCDFRPKKELHNLRRSFEKSGFQVESYTDISKQVLSSLGQTSENKKDFVSKSFPSVLQSLMETFSGVEGTKIYEGLKDGSIIYPSFVLRKFT